MVGVEALRPEGRGLMGRSRVGVRGVASGEGRGCLCARRLYVRVGVLGHERALGGGSGVMRGGSVRVRRPGLLTVGVCGEEASVGRRVAVRHFLIDIDHSLPESGWSPFSPKRPRRNGRLAGHEVSISDRNNLGFRSGLSAGLPACRSSIYCA